MSAKKLFCSRNLYQKQREYVTWTRLQQKRQQQQQQRHKQQQQRNYTQYFHLNKNSKIHCVINDNSEKYSNNNRNDNILESQFAAIINGIICAQSDKCFQNRESIWLFSSNQLLQQQRQHNQQQRAYSVRTMTSTTGDVFAGVVDRFKGVTVDAKVEFVEIDKFPAKLQKSLDYWQANKNRAIWFRVYKEHAHWVPILAEAGFDFHHAKTGVVMMYRWLPTHESSNLPNYAHTLLGVGGIVINERNEILVVSDRYAMIPNSWKLPGGYVEPCENLVDAAIREVFEETGIQSSFRSVVCLRHSHGGNFGCSDIYCVIGLEPKNYDFKRCEREIARLQWMPVQEFLQHPQVHETNRHFVRTYLDYRQRGLVIKCQRDVHQILKKEYNLYYVADGVDAPVEKESH